VNIFSDRAFLPEGVPHAPMLYPFWGHVPIFDDPVLDAHRFDRYVERGRDLFRLTGLEEARAAVLPFDWNHTAQNTMYRIARGIPPDPEERGRAAALAEEFAALAASGGRPTVVFLTHDHVEEVSLAGSFVFRTSMLASRRRPHEHALPYWMPDEVEARLGGELPLREKAARPSVGFCGQSPMKMDVRSRLDRRLRATRAVRALARLLGRSAQLNYAFYARAQALEALSRSREVRTNFVLRRAWFDGNFDRGVERPRLEQTRREYVENIFGSDYVLCARGMGNYSIRFYETLSCGRIPVFVNTDCVLPFEEWIDWKSYCVWVEAHEVARAAEKVAEFHDGLSDAEFRDRQRACRQLWLDWLSPLGFFKNFRRYFESE
jgi:hypothetical protein